MCLVTSSRERCAVLGRCKTLALGLGVSLSLQATSVASRWLPRGRHDLHKSHATTLVTMLVAASGASVGGGGVGGGASGGGGGGGGGGEGH